MLKLAHFMRPSVVVVLLLAARLANAQAPVEFPGPATNPEVAIVDASTQVLDQVMRVPSNAIPTALLRDAQGIAVIPGMVKGGFVVGVRHGRGIVTTRTENGAWTAPTFITVTGGSVGWQAGLQSTDVILVFKTKKSIDGLLNGKFTVGADASAAAGPVGRDASISTDAALGAEIYSYSRSRGLFAGIALDGSVIQVDPAANNRYYYSGGAPAQAGQPQPIPQSATQFLAAVAKYTSPDAQMATANEIATAGAPVGETQQVLEQLLDSIPPLNKILDAQWQAYLALPGTLFNPDLPATDGQPLPTLPTMLARYEKVTKDPQYQALAKRPEFQRTYALLQHYAELTKDTGPIALPPPPQ